MERDQGITSSVSSTASPEIPDPKVSGASNKTSQLPPSLSSSESTNSAGLPSRSSSNAFIADGGLADTRKSSSSQYSLSSIYSFSLFFLSLLPSLSLIPTMCNPQTNNFDTFSTYWYWVVLPLALTSLTISFYARVNSSLHLIYLQCVLAILPSEFYFVVYDGVNVDTVVRWAILIPAYIFINTKLRQFVARTLDETALLTFLNLTIFKYCICVGLPQLGLILFGAVQCIREMTAEFENDPNHDTRNIYSKCNRTLFSQTGLGVIIFCGTTYNLFLGVAQILDAGCAKRLHFNWRR